MTLDEFDQRTRDDAVCLFGLMDKPEFHGFKADVEMRNKLSNLARAAKDVTDYSDYIHTVRLGKLVKEVFGDD